MDSDRSPSLPPKSPTSPWIDAQPRSSHGPALRSRPRAGLDRPRPVALNDPVQLTLRLVLSFSLLIWAARLFVSTYSFGLAAPLAISATLVGALISVLVSVTRSPTWLHRTDMFLMCVVVALSAIWIAALVAANPAYGTDEAAITQGAVQALLHHSNPYALNYLGVMQRLGVGANSLTATVAGQVVTNFQYPAGLLYLQLPFVIFFGRPGVLWGSMFYYLTAAVFLWSVAPPSLRNPILILLTFSTFASAAASGLLVFESLPFIIASLITFRPWTRERPALTMVVSPVFFGLACSIRQEPWLLLPFVIVLAGRSSTARLPQIVLRSGGYLALTLLVFAVVNWPLVAAAPSLWVQGVLGPIFGHNVPLGAGAVGMALYVFHGSGNLGLFTAAAVLAGVAGLFFEFRTPLRVVIAMPFIVVVMMFLSTRPLFDYALFFLMVGLTLVGLDLGQAGDRVHQLPRWLDRSSLLMALLAGLGSVVAIVLGVTSPTPLSLSIRSVSTDGQAGTVNQISLRVTNRSDRRVSPIFSVDAGPYVTPAWLLAAGPSTLDPHQSAVVVLDAPSPSQAPLVVSRFRVYAFTSSPTSLSEAPLYEVAAYHAELLPLYVGRVVPLGSEITLRVLVLDAFDSAVRRRGIEVSLSSASYTAKGILRSVADVVGVPKGRAVAVERTNADGVATFHVLALQPTPYEVFFQAWLGGSRGPYGYSNQTGVWFGTRVASGK